jgi:thioester reductase-like protein
LLTGVTGFLGVYLLNELINTTQAIIYCHIRAANQTAAKQRLQKTLLKYQLKHLVNNPKIKIIIGDLEKKFIGISPNVFKRLAKKVDSIYHCGAYVNHIYHYQQLYPANVRSTRELLKFAALGKNKAFHYISTISCVSNLDDKGYAREACPKQNLPKLLCGYTLTKWASERMLCSAMQHGFAITIYRPGNITGSSINGISNPERNHLLLLLKSCIQLGMAPDWDAYFDMVSIDIVAKSIIGLSLEPNSKSRLYNMQNSKPPTWRQFIKWVNKYGFKIKMVKPEIWHKHIRAVDEQNALYPLLTYYLNGGAEELRASAKVKYQKTQKHLHKIGIYYSKYNKDYIFKCLDYLVAISFL